MTSMPRTTRIAGSFAIVMIAYWAYALLAVRWIEPAAVANRREDISNRERDRVQQLEDVRQEQFKGLFAPGSWELQNPKILESDRAKLLCQTYKNHPDGRVEFHPCTIVFAHEGPGDEDQRRRQSIILEAPGGAMLQFDRPLDLGHFQMGRLVRGQLNNEVRIRSDWKEPGPQDDLLIVAHDVQLTERTISTPKDVRFQWGPHFGSGRDMMIRLLAGKRTSDSGGSLNVAGIESFELRQVRGLHLELGQTLADQKTPNAASQAQKTESVPIDIRCRGAFRFDVVGRTATFRDSVDIVKPNPDGPPDRIVCDLLSLFFVDRANPSGPNVPAIASSKKADSLDLTVDRIEAAGKPVVVTAPSQKLVARGEKLVYSLTSHSIALEGGQEVFLQQESNEIHARSLHYQSAAESWRLGRVEAQGPGWLRAHSREKADQQLEAVWKGRLQLAPDKQFQRIALTGGAELSLRDRGQLQAQLQANQINFWLVESPPTATNPNADRRPDLMMAQGDVRINSSNICGKNLQQLEVWFAGGTTDAERETAVASASGNPSASGQPSPTPSGAPVSPTDALGSTRFEVQGRLLRTRVVLHTGQPAAISNLTLEDGVQFVETNAPPGERPLLLRGDRLEAIDVSSPNAAVTVTGQPARFEGRGLGGLIASNIHLDCGANRLWIDGPGQMEIPLATDFENNPLVVPCALTVNWQRGMNFDGRETRFEQQVLADAPGLQSTKKTTQFQLRTETMRILLQRPIRFTQANRDARPKPETFQCNGGVAIEQREFDAQQQLISHDRLEAADLGINILSGALTAGGPGWVNHVGYGTTNPLGGPGDSFATANAPTGPKTLNCVNVRFQESITGNVGLHRTLTFADQVELAFGPVSHWDAILTAKDPKQLGPDGVVAQCDRLSVVHMLLPVGNQRAIEVAAEGNAVVEGIEFTATGHRITYAEAKGLLILEGNNLADAKLFQQAEAGGERNEHAARKISYWLRTKQVRVEGAQSLQIGQPPTNNRRQ